MKHTLTLFLVLFPFFLSAQTYDLREAFPSLPATQRPIDLQYVPDGSNRLVIVQQTGLAYIFNNARTTSTRKVFIDLREVVSQGGGELGFLGLAFHPNFAENGFIFVNFTTTNGAANRSYISRFTASGVFKDTVQLSTRKDILSIYQPYPNHNGGWIGFGPDGYLYTSLGDGGSGGDPQNRAQNKDSLLGKILRLDIENGDPYSIPPSNPFALNGGRPEIYAYGLRNAWRCSFDMQTKKLWAGDVGQGTWEEVDTITNGGNYGWKVKEGYMCASPGCDSTGFQSALCVYPHPGKGPKFTGISITGGYVYRGQKVPSLIGKYVFADLNGKVFKFTYDGLQTGILDSIENLGLNISSFGTDQNNELYIVSYANGRIYEFTPEAGAVEDPIAETPLAIITPNPASTTISIQPRWMGTAELTVTDIAGKVVRRYTLEGSEVQTINIEALLPGAYTILLSSQGHSFTSKLVIRR